MIKNSIGTKMFRNLFAYLENGEEKDILQNGKNSCAVFVSAVLYMSKLIESMHATVASTVKDLEKSGWGKVENPKSGDVLVWEPFLWPGDKEKHEHIGFYIGDEKAISNDSKSGTPQEHHITYGEESGSPVRKITAIYRHPKINSK